MQIFELMKIESTYLYISNWVFTINSSTDNKIVFWSFLGRDFICRSEKKSTLSVKLFIYFWLQKYPIFWTYNEQILFFAPVCPDCPVLYDCFDHDYGNSSDSSNNASDLGHSKSHQVLIRRKKSFSLNTFLPVGQRAIPED